MGNYQEDLTLKRAVEAIRRYNRDLYKKAGKPNADVDQSALTMFKGGLAKTVEGIEAQIRFVGVDYGGSAVSLSHSQLPPLAAHNIFEVMDRYASTIAAVAPILEGGRATYEQIEFLYGPFSQTVKGPIREWKNWIVWASKFWHFLNPSSFPIMDRLACKFFDVPEQDRKVDEYMEYAKRFQAYVLNRNGWLPELRAEDGGLARSDVKLWDKVIYQFMADGREQQQKRESDRAGNSRRGRRMVGSKSAATKDATPGVVRQTSVYADGKPALEIHVRKSDAVHLPIKSDGEKNCSLIVDGRTWTGLLRRTAEYDYVWISPKVWDSAGKRCRLVDALSGLAPNDHVWLRIDDSTIEIRPM